jgi:hypothetical protein
VKWLKSTGGGGAAVLAEREETEGLRLSEAAAVGASKGKMRSKSPMREGREAVELSGREVEEGAAVEEAEEACTEERAAGRLWREREAGVVAAAECLGSPVILFVVVAARLLEWRWLPIDFFNLLLVVDAELDADAAAAEEVGVTRALLTEAEGRRVEERAAGVARSEELGRVSWREAAAEAAAAVAVEGGEAEGEEAGEEEGEPCGRKEEGRVRRAEEELGAAGAEVC